MKKSSELSSELPQALEIKSKLNYEAPQMKVIMPTSSTEGKTLYFSEGPSFGPVS